MKQQRHETEMLPSGYEDSDMDSTISDLPSPYMPKYRSKYEKTLEPVGNNNIYHLLNVDADCLGDFPVDTRYDTVVVQNTRKLIAEISTLMENEANNSSYDKLMEQSTVKQLTDVEKQLKCVQDARKCRSQTIRTNKPKIKSKFRQSNKTIVQDGICIIFANSPIEEDQLVEDTVGDADKEIEDIFSEFSHQCSESRIRQLVSSMCEFFNVFLDFKVIVHWNKNQQELLKCLRETAIEVMDKDCIFMVMLGQGTSGDYVTYSGNSIPLSEIFSTMTIGQRGMAPLFVFGEVEKVQNQTCSNCESNRPILLADNQLLVWLENTVSIDLLFDQIRKTWMTKDVGSTVGTFVEWVRKGEHRHDIRYITTMNQLVYLENEDLLVI